VSEGYQSILVFFVSPIAIALVCHAVFRRFTTSWLSFIAAMALSIVLSLVVFFFSDWAIRGYPADYLTPWLLIPLIMGAAIFALISGLVGIGIKKMSDRRGVRSRATDLSDRDSSSQ
jgi:hypothetical protein